MEIVYYPDPVLLRRAAPVDPRREGLPEFVAAMVDAMHASQGVGLAAPQVGESLRVFVASESGQVEDALAFINPRIEPYGPVVDFEEGCLSFPDIRAPIRRPQFVRVRWQDAGGADLHGEFDGLLARIIQHEYDHLDGVLFTERMTPADRLRIRPDLAALAEQYRPR